MIRLPLIIAGGALAAAAAVTPALVGLTGNPSFSQQVPVRVPAHATLATFPTGTNFADGREHSTDRGEIGLRHRDDPHRSPVDALQASPRRSASEPGEDRGHGQGSEPGDDRGRGQQAEPGDDRGRGREDSRGRIDRFASSERSAIESGNDRGAGEGRRRGGDDDGRR